MPKIQATLGNGSRSMGPGSRSPTKSGSELERILRPPPQATIVHHLFAKMGHRNAIETEMHSWCNADIDETISATSKGLAEMFLGQAPHAKEFKNLSKENKILKFKVNHAENDKKNG